MRKGWWDTSQAKAASDYAQLKKVLGEFGLENKIEFDYGPNSPL
jgi:hypothetical protein